MSFRRLEGREGSSWLVLSVCCAAAAFLRAASSSSASFCAFSAFLRRFSSFSSLSFASSSASCSVFAHLDLGLADMTVFLVLGLRAAGLVIVAAAGVVFLSSGDFEERMGCWY